MGSILNADESEKVVLWQIFSEIRKGGTNVTIPMI